MPRTLACISGVASSSRVITVGLGNWEVINAHEIRVSRSHERESLKSRRESDGCPF
jgi:hypothetical protein